MTSPISLAAQIDAVRLALTGVVSQTYTKGSALYDGAAAHADALRAALATLEEHERALAVVAAMRRLKLDPNLLAHNRIRHALAAFDTARRRGGDG